MSVHRAEFPIATMCRVLGISSSGYYAWTTRAPSRRARSNAALTKTVRTIHAVSRGTYGAPRVHAELRTVLVTQHWNAPARVTHQPRDTVLAGGNAVCRQRRTRSTGVRPSCSRRLRTRASIANALHGASDIENPP